MAITNGNPNNATNPFPINRLAFNAPHHISTDGRDLNPLSAGEPIYSGGFIPEIWSGKLIENFYDTTVLAAISNTDHESEIKAYGDTVKINNTPYVSVQKYSKGDLLKTQIPNAPLQTLLIDEGQYFSCLSEDVDKQQVNMNLMNIWTEEASKSMKIAIDTEVLGNIGGLAETRSTAAKAVASTKGEAADINKGKLAGRISKGFDLGVESAVPTGNAASKMVAGTDIWKTASRDSLTITRANVINYIINMGTVLDEANCPEGGRFLVIPAALSGLILKSELRDASISGDGVTMQRNGRIGMIDRFTIYQSHNLKRTFRQMGDEPTKRWTEFNVFAGHKMALTFASQMVEMETLRTETTFGDVVRGLQVYGFKILKPEAILESVISIPVGTLENTGAAE